MGSVQEYCVKFAEEYGDVEMMEGYLRCILELDSLDASARR